MASNVTQRLRYLLADLVSANIAVFVFDVIRYYVLRAETADFSSLKHFLTFNVLVAEQIALPFVVLAIYFLAGFYNKPYNKSYVQVLFSTLGATFFNTLLIYFALLVNSQTSIRMESYELLFYLFASLFTSCIIGRAIVMHLTHLRIKKGKLRFNVAVAGCNSRGREIAASIDENSRYNGYRFAGFITLPGEIADKECVSPENAAAFCKEKNITEIIAAPSSTDEKTITRLLAPFFSLGIPLKINTESIPVLSSSIKLQSIYEEPYIDLTSANITESTRNIKRLLDILISAISLILLALPMCIIAAAVRVDSRGGVFFRQERIGYRGRPFRILKFRTMRTDAEAAGPQLSSADDARITKIGRYLRKYRLDELPQFWNVLKGDMSIVGPRPEREFFIKQIRAVAPQYALVHQVRPGITSWGMVKYGYASSVPEMVERLRYDLIYLANISITVDVKILIHTVKTVLKGRGK